MPNAVVLDTLKRLGATPEIDIVCLTKKDGNIIASAGEVDGLQLETFGIMSATIYGAANTANEHLQKEKPQRIVIRAEDGDTVISKVDRAHILVLRTHTRENFGGVLKKMDETIEQLRENWG